MKRPRVDVNLEELDQIIDRGTHAPLSESEGEKLKGALHALAGMLAKPRSTEKTSAVLEPSEAPPRKALLLHRVTGATALNPIRVRRRLRFRTPASLPGLRERQSLPAERTQDAGAHSRTSAAGSHGV